MRRHGTFAALFGLAMLVAGSNAAAGDDKTEDARAYFNRGVESFREGAYDAALVQFKAAYATAPNYRVLYNVGQTSLKLQDFAAALAAFERYLAEGGTDLPSDRRAAVEQEIERLAGRVSRVTIVSNAAGGEILVDDVAVGRLPLPDGVRVSAGRRKLTIVPDGGAPISRVVDVPGGTPARSRRAFGRARARDATATRSVRPPTARRTGRDDAGRPHRRVGGSRRRGGPRCRRRRSGDPCARRQVRRGRRARALPGLAERPR